MKNYLKKKGFTLIELLVTISVLAVLASGTIIVLDPSTQIQKSRDAQRKSDLAQIQRALETYYNDYGYYPASIPFGSAWSVYMGKVPQDTISGRNYFYSLGSTNQMYYIYASFERSKDPQMCKADGSTCTGIAIPANSCGTGKICNYGVTSPNTSP